MSWQLLALISVTSLSVSNLLGRVLMKDDKSDPIGYGIIFQFGLGLVALVFALVFNKFVWPQGYGFSIRFLISTLLWTLTTVFSFSSIKRIGASEATILVSSGSLVSIFLGITVLGESITIKLFLGSLLVLVAVWIVTTEKLKFTSRKGVVFSLLAALCSGIAVVNDAIILRTYEAFSYTTIMSFLPGILPLMLFPLKFKTTVVNIDRNFLWRMSILCLLYAVQAITYYLAFQVGAPVSQLSPITRSSVVLTVILAAIFINERNNLFRKLIAAGVMIFGVILLG